MAGKEPVGLLPGQKNAMPDLNGYVAEIVTACPIVLALAGGHCDVLFRQSVSRQVMALPVLGVKVRFIDDPSRPTPAFLITVATSAMVLVQEFGDVPQSDPCTMEKRVPSRTA
jgi:hypothetical protein